MSKLKVWAKNVKRQVYVLYFAYKDKRVSWYAKLFAVCVVAYAFSPIDLIPDFIPLLGYLDDIILVPLGVVLALKMIPEKVIADCEGKAEAAMDQSKPTNWLAGVFVLGVWLFAGIWIAMEIYQAVK